MHAQRLLHSLFTESCIQIDKRIRNILHLAAETLIEAKQLSISSLGRSLNRASKVKHDIKTMDRLFGNKLLQIKRNIYYQGIAKIVLKDNKRPGIIIDWSGLTPCGAYHFLRASVVVSGRALTLYEKSYTLKDYGKSKIHRDFLKELRRLLPLNCQPIIVTDAGFRNTWFRQVLSLGWDYIGRVRNKTQYCEKHAKQWKPIKSLYAQAKLTARYVGHVKLAQSHPLKCHFYLQKQQKKYRQRLNLSGRKIQCSMSKKHARRENEPWLLASSLSPQELSVVEIMLLYKKRMQIEEAFRDLKNTRNGFGLRQCRSFTAGRLNIALLISTLAMLVLWLYGVAAKQKSLHYGFQSNTERKRNVLSIIVIGWQVINRRTGIINNNDLMRALETIRLTALGNQLC